MIQQQWQIYLNYYQRMEISSPKKRVNRDKCVFRDKTAYVWGLRYRWDPLLSRNLIPRFPHFKPPWFRLNLDWSQIWFYFDKIWSNISLTGLNVDVDGNLCQFVMGFISFFQIPVQKGRAWQQQEPKLYSSGAPAWHLLLYPLAFHIDVLSQEKQF